LEDRIEKMKSLLGELLPRDGLMETDIKGVSLFRRDKPYEPKAAIYQPKIIMLAQGKKNVFLGDRVYTYDSRNFFALTVPLPVLCEALIEEDKPLLGMSLRMDPQMIGEMLYEMDSKPSSAAVMNDSIFQETMSETILESVIRLLETLRSRNETKILGPLYLKEILFKILNGEHGDSLKELVYKNRTLYQISRVISRIHEDFSQTLEVQALAEEAGMSPSSFHSNFKSVTSTSPLQYIKNIRLHKAKELIQQEGEKAYEAALRVGYESSSQFNREYKRLFGVTPAKDRAEVPAV